MKPGLWAIGSAANALGSAAWRLGPCCRSLAGMIGLALSVVGCTQTVVSGHVAAADYANDPRRILVINAIDSSFAPDIVDGFKVAITADLARCGIATSVYRPPFAAYQRRRLSQEAVPLDILRKGIAAAVQDFKPDAMLQMQQRVRHISAYGDILSGDYTVTLYDIGQNREVWKGNLTLKGGDMFSRGDTSGSSFADVLTAQLSRDNIIKSCPKT